MGEAEFRLWIKCHTPAAMARGIWQKNSAAAHRPRRYIVGGAILLFHAGNRWPIDGADRWYVGGHIPNKHSACLRAPDLHTLAFDATFALSGDRISARRQ